MISLLKSKFNSQNLRVIYLSADKLSVHRITNKKESNTYIFDTDDAGKNNFERYLAESINIPSYILLDLFEEKFEQITIPHVLGSDHKALIKRKRARLFRNSNYFYAVKQGRKTHGRRDDCMLLTAFTDEELIKPWVKLLYKHKVPLKGILSFPHLLELFIKNIDCKSEYNLLVTVHSIGGLRQTFFHKKHLKISRITKPPEYSPNNIKPYTTGISSEISKMHLYLNSLQLLPDNAVLNVFFIADDTTLNEFEFEEKKSHYLNNYSLSDNLYLTKKYHPLSISRVAKKNGIKLDETMPFCDQLFSLYLLKSAPPNCYASNKEMHYNKMCLIRQVINIASIVTLTASVIYSSLSFVDGFLYKKLSKDIKNSTNIYHEKYSIAKQQLPETKTSPSKIKYIVDIFKTLSDHKLYNYKIISAIGSSLEDYPNIKLEKLEWGHNKEIDPSPKRSKNSNNSRKNEDKNSKYYQATNISAYIEPFDGDYRKAIVIVNNFIATLLNKKIIYDVQIKSLPINIGSNASLSGNTLTIDKIAKFKLKAIVDEPL